MAGLLEFSQYIGGADNLQTEQAFPSTQRTVVYNFNQDITGWSFYMDYQTVVVDTVAYDRNTGAPNFASSKIIGTFPSGVITTATYVQGVVNTGTFVRIISTASGTVAITFPGGLYAGPILPDARSHNPITVIGITWSDDNIPPQINTHRWAFIQSWEPGVTPGDPVLANNFTAIVGG
jgi:hypothetical protein